MGQFCTVSPTGAVVSLGQLSPRGSCRTGAVVALGQLSNWGSCPTGAVVSLGHFGAVVAWAVVGASQPQLVI